MGANDFGIEELVPEDSDYRGSRFSDVRDAIFANPYQPVWGAEDAPPLPYGPANFWDLIRGVGTSRFLLKLASVRTLASRGDLRWGPDRKGFLRIIHRYGVCLTGCWRITEANDYTGYFSAGSEALVVARYSNAVETRRGKARGQGLACKIFPTTEPGHVAPIPTANFFVMDDLIGSLTRHLNDVSFVNAPSAWLPHDWLSLPMAMVVAQVFGSVDKEPLQRRLNEVSALGVPTGEPTHTPKYMRLSLVEGHPRIPGEGLDSRDELLAMMFDKGDPTPKRTLTFAIDVTETAKAHGRGPFLKMEFGAWRRIGTLVFDNAVASVNGDRVLHFHHPRWRSNPDDPGTEIRP